MSQTLHVDIQESAEELKRLMNVQQRARLRERLQVLYWIKVGLFQSLQEIADHLGRSKSIIFKWLQTYRAQGLAGLLKWNFHQCGRRSSLPVDVRAELEQRLKDPQGGFASYRDVKNWLFETHDLDLPYSTVHRIVRYELKAKLKTPRPFPIQRDEAAVVEFKKKLPEMIDIIDLFQGVDHQPALPIRYWSQDESRFGLHTLTRSVLTALGIKPIRPMQFNFQSFYLYGAVEPQTGDSFFLEFSHLDADCFQLFLNQFSQAYPESLNIIQLDNGRFHKAQKLTIPDNVVLLFQPPYSPDVNPIERVWQSFKDKLGWLNFKNLDQLRKELGDIVRSILPDELASLTGFDFILTAINNKT